MGEYRVAVIRLVLMFLKWVMSWLIWGIRVMHLWSWSSNGDATENAH